MFAVQPKSLLPSYMPTTSQTHVLIETSNAVCIHIMFYIGLLLLKAPA